MVILSVWQWPGDPRDFVDDVGLGDSAMIWSVQGCGREHREIGK